MKPESYRKIIETLVIGNRAVARAREENLRLGLPNVYSRNGKLYFELPGGQITDKLPPEMMKRLKLS